MNPRGNQSTSKASGETAGLGILLVLVVGAVILGFCEAFGVSMPVW